jgi:[acyl-carrier-protein] S-malonyltransferase
MLAMLAPGQGAQAPGQLASWLELPGTAERLGGWSEAAGFDLIQAGTTASAEEIRDTAVAQPLLLATALIAAEELLGEGASAGPSILAGHSIGELAAAVLSGALSAEAGMRLARVRGTAMAQASAAAPTGMSAVLGGDGQAVTAYLEQMGLTAANRNGAGQIVAAGSLELLAKLAENPPPDARVRPLQVAGAFHSPAMESARRIVANHVVDLDVADPTIPVLSNADGGIVRSGPELLSRLVAQITAPVRFDLCWQAMQRVGVTTVIELPPAGTLAGLARRTLPGITIVKLTGPDDLAAAREKLDAPPVTIPASLDALADLDPAPEHA